MLKNNIEPDVKTKCIEESRTQAILVEVISIIGSFAVWEAANIWIVEVPELRLNRHRLAWLEETEVLITVS